MLGKTLGLTILVILFVSTHQIKTDDDVRKCIQDVGGADVDVVCKNKDNISCYNAFHSLTLCLLNNNCNKVEPTAEVSVI